MNKLNRSKKLRIPERCVDITHLLKSYAALRPQSALAGKWPKHVLEALLVFAREQPGSKVLVSEEKFNGKELPGPIVALKFVAKPHKK